jgi:O-antigen/teichoic acid export membrane protein
MTYSNLLLSAMDVFKNVNNPRFFALMRTDKHAAVSMLSSSLCFFSVLALFLGVFSKNILSVFVDPRYLQAYIYIPVIEVGLLFFLMYLNTVGTLFNQDKTASVSAITVSSSVVSLVISFVLIGKFGIWGAAISFAITNLLMASFVYARCQQICPLAWPIRKAVIMCLTPLSAYIVLSGSLQGGIYKILLFVFLALILVFLAKNEIKQLYA